jgi:hypothetical protein
MSPSNIEELRMGERGGTDLVVGGGMMVRQGADRSWVMGGANRGGREEEGADGR